MAAKAKDSSTARSKKPKHLDLGKYLDRLPSKEIGICELLRLFVGVDL